MSQTLSVDVVGPSHWTYMATVMAECLDRIAQAGVIDANAIPSGVYKDARAFWRLAASGFAPDNLPALNAYVIAFETLRGALPVSPTREDVEQQLKDYEAFLSTLEAPRALDANEKTTVEALKNFFTRLKEEGECEAYTQVMQLETLPSAFPFR